MATLDLFSLSKLAELTGISIRKLRYCVDHELTPQRTYFLAALEHGQPRHLDTIGAVSVCCAAQMLESGVKRETVRYFMKTTELLNKPGRNSLNLPLIAEAFCREISAVVHLGDHTHMRWQVGGHDSGWILVKSRPPRQEEFRPVVTISVDVAAIRTSILGS
jgi:hypothetical protein